MARIEYRNDVTRATEEAEGSDGRLNVSSRSDGRSYYNSRDQGQCYSASFQHTAGTSGQYSFDLKNTSTDKTLVISTIEINSVVTARFKLWFSSGATNGDAVVPVNLNKDSSNDAQCTFLEDNSTTIDTVTTSGAPIEDVQVGTLGHVDMVIKDRVRLGQNDAVSLELDTTATNTLAHGTIFFFFE